MTTRLRDQKRSKVKPEVAVCSGKDCRKRAEYAQVVEDLAGACRITKTRCLSACKGPVVILEPTSSSPLAFARLRKPKRLRDFLRLALGTHRMSSRLQDCLLTGSARDKAIKRARR